MSHTIPRRKAREGDAARMWDHLFSSVDLLGKGLDAAWLRNEVISNNIANVDTPGYKSQEVKFEDIMASALDSSGQKLDLQVTDQQHIAKIAPDIREVEPVVVKEEDTSAGVDENNVDVETEMVALAKNTIEYYLLVSKINSEFDHLNTAINVP